LPLFAPLVHGKTLKRFPVLREVLGKLKGKISDQMMTDLNYKVDYEHKRPRKVAREFLKEMGFKTSVPKKQGSPDIAIGSKSFSEQYILAEMFTTLIENYTDLTVAVKTGLAGTKVCLDAVTNGEIDIYPEYTGTAFLVHLKADKKIRDAIMHDKDAVYKYVKREEKKRFDLEWLEPLGFQNTYALMMRKEQVEKLKLKTISDLADMLNKGCGK